MYKLAIVGRPNVGKSALFNRICGKRIAIVDEAEGITRDRLYAKSEIFGFPFEIVDCGGIDPHSSDPFKDFIQSQSYLAIQEADGLIMVVDGKIGLTLQDHELALILLKTGKPLTLAVNKVDAPDQVDLLHQFYGLGIPKIVAVSALQAYQIAELLEEALKENLIKQEDEDHDASNQEEDSKQINIAVVGRTNVGKSTLVNMLLEENRCLVSPIPGTTRDSVDVKLGKYVLIDTAGIRRKKAEHEVVDKFAAIRTEDSIDRSDVCLLVLDAQDGLTVQEKRIAKNIEKAGKSCIVLLNKWDLVKGFRMEHCLASLHQEIPFLAHCPTLFISAKIGRNIDRILPEVDKVYQAAGQRISTHQLNKFVEKSIQINHPPMLNGKRLRIYYMTQVGTKPPRFVFFVNHTDLMSQSYKKYLLNQFRRQYSFTGTPLEFHLRGKPQSN